MKFVFRSVQWISIICMSGFFGLFLLKLLEPGPPYKGLDFLSLARSCVTSGYLITGFEIFKKSKIDWRNILLIGLFFVTSLAMMLALKYRLVL